mgnify:CR=1 FL=1
MKRRSGAGRRDTGPVGQRGQATLEVIAGVPLLALGALVALQLCAVAYAVHLADGAAEAGALAIAADRPPGPAVRGALPAWAADEVSVEAESGHVRVEVQPPAPLPAIAKALTVDSSAWARPPDGDG